jgi:hypothetical protein
MTEDKHLLTHQLLCLLSPERPVDFVALGRIVSGNGFLHSATPAIPKQGTQSIKQVYTKENRD